MKSFLWLFFLILLTACHGKVNNTIAASDHNTEKNLSSIQEQKEEINRPPDTITIITLTLGAIGIICAFISVNRQNKANTITHFREKWLQDLGNTYCGCVVANENICQKLKKQALGQKELDLTEDKDWQKIELGTTKIKLLLHFYKKDEKDSDKEKIHPHSQFWNEFAAYVEKSQKHYSSGTIDANTRIELKTEREKMEELLQKILRDEWEKLKLLENKNPFKKSGY